MDRYSSGSVREEVEKDWLCPRPSVRLFMLDDLTILESLDLLGDGLMSSLASLICKISVS